MSKELLSKNLETFYDAVDDRASELAFENFERGQQFYEGAVLGVSIPLSYRIPDGSDEMLIPMFREGFIYHGREDLQKAALQRAVLSCFSYDLMDSSLPLGYTVIANEGRPNDQVMSPWNIVEERINGIAPEAPLMGAFYEGAILSLTHLMTGRPLDGSLTHIERERFLRASQSNIYSSAFSNGYDRETHMRNIIENWDSNWDAMSLGLAAVQSERAGEEIDYDDRRSLEKSIMRAEMKSGIF